VYVQSYMHGILITSWSHTCSGMGIAQSQLDYQKQDEGLCEVGTRNVHVCALERRGAIHAPIAKQIADSSKWTLLVGAHHSAAAVKVCL
jgi:hypothetical protein